MKVWKTKKRVNSIKKHKKQEKKKIRLKKKKKTKEEKKRKGKKENKGKKNIKNEKQKNKTKQNKTKTDKKLEKKKWKNSAFGFSCQITLWSYLDVSSTLKFLYETFGQCNLLPMQCLSLKFLKAFSQSKYKTSISFDYVRFP